MIYYAALITYHTGHTRLMSYNEDKTYVRAEGDDNRKLLEGIIKELIKENIIAEGQIVKFDGPIITKDNV